MIYLIQKMSKTSKNHRNSTVTPNEINYIWKMIRKIQGIHLYHFHAWLNNVCPLFWTKQINGIWNVLYGVWIWTFGSNQLHLIWLIVALAQSTAYCHVMIMHHIVALHWFCSFSVASICPLSVDVVPTMRSMTPMKSYIIFRSARQAKLTCSFRYKPTLSLLHSFTALGQQWFNCYMLR